MYYNILSYVVKLSINIDFVTRLETHGRCFVAMWINKTKRASIKNIFSLVTHSYAKASCSIMRAIILAAAVKDPEFCFLRA